MMTLSTAATGAVQKFTSGEATEWMEWSGIALADVLNEDERPGVKLGAIGFLRAPRGSSSEFAFPYDEALIVTKGRCTVRSNGAELSAEAGDVLYLPAGVPGTFHAEGDLELVYVASSPYGEVNREMKATLLASRSG
jgi:ethanolamine utilization protein EutQ (cupin superfamily)